MAAEPEHVEQLESQTIAGAHDPLTGGDPLGQVRQFVEVPPLQVEQEESQLEQRKFVVVLLTYWPVGQAHAPLRATRLPGQVRHWLAAVPEQVKQLKSQDVTGKHDPAFGAFPSLHVRQLLVNGPTHVAQVE